MREERSRNLHLDRLYRNPDMVSPVRKIDLQHVFLTAQYGTRVLGTFQIDSPQ
jgi:hypothetical protein